MQKQNTSLFYFFLYDFRLWIRFINTKLEIFIRKLITKKKSKRFFNMFFRLEVIYTQSHS